MSYMCVGPLWKKIEAEADRLYREKLERRRMRSIDSQYRHARFQEVKAIRYARVGARTPEKIIIYQVATKHGFYMRDLTTPCRRRDIAYARFEAIYRLKVERKLSFPQIAKLVGLWDHTSALHGYRKHKEKMEAA